MLMRHSGHSLAADLWVLFGCISIEFVAYELNCTVGLLFLAVLAT